MKVESLYEGHFRLVRVTTDRTPKEVFCSEDSLSLLLYCPARGQILLVRQPRESLLLRKGREHSRITETVAGRFDRGQDPITLAVQEAKEEVGVTLRPEQVQLLNDGVPMAVSAGGATEHAYLAYAEISDDQIGPSRPHFSAAGEDERIYRIFFNELTLDRRVYEDVRVFALVQWFLRSVVDRRPAR